MKIKDFQERVEVYLMKLEIELLSDENRKIIELNHEYFNQFPQKAGVYLLREEGEICYISETNNLQSKIYELLDIREHELRRQIGKQKFADKPNYKEASASKKFPDWIEKEIDRMLVDNFELSFLEVKLGRKELEERIKEKFKLKYNFEKVTDKIELSKNQKEKAYSLEEIRKTKPKAYAKWTDDDDKKLLELDAEGKKPKELAKIFERSRGAIKSRLEKLKELNE